MKAMLFGCATTNRNGGSGISQSIFLTCQTCPHARNASRRQSLQGMNGPQASREAGYAANPHAARVNASRRLAKTSVAARVAELQAEHAAKNAITVAGQLSKLEEVRLQAIEDRNQSAAVAAIVAENKLCGLIIDKAQVEAIVRRLSPAPGIETGVILSECVVEAHPPPLGDRRRTGGLCRWGLRETLFRAWRMQ